MTATLEQPVGASGPAAVGAAASIPRPPGRQGRRRSATTPARMRTLLTALLLLSLAWGAFGGWAADVHASAASAMASVDEPLSLDAQQLDASIADADVTATTMFLASAQPKLATLQAYQGDVATAAADLSKLRAASGQNQVTSAALAAIGADLPVYTGYVSEARSAYALGYPLTGGSFVQVASEEAHLDLLPAATTVFDQENDVLAAASGQATGWPLVIAALVLAIVTGVLLYRAQRWLTRRTNRVLNLGLALASLLLVISASWLVAAFLSGRSDLEAGIGHGSQPAQQLAQASIDVQRIRGDAVLNVISRSGDASFQSDFTATSGEVGPGDASPGHLSLLGSAAAAENSGTQAAALVGDAEHEATAWYAANANVYALGKKANYAGERSAVIGSGTGSSAVGYQALEPDITRAISDDQAAFRSAVSTGSGALNPVEPVVIIAALLMALGCWRGLSRRLAEYR
jgi:hypothetical protein